MNIFGEGQKEGLTNPLTENLLANDFNALDFNEVHLNELHDNSGTGKIVVHEEFNMTNNKISNVADPTQNKDAVNKSYVDGVISSSVPYDLYVAFSDETSLLTAGSSTGVIVYAPRTINLAVSEWTIVGYLSTPPTNSLTFDIYLDLAGGPSILKSITFAPGSVKSTASTGANYLAIVQDTPIYATPLSSDPTATGLKIVFKGTV